MLTLEQLKQMPIGTIFAEGITEEGSKGCMLAKNGQKFKWIARRGMIYDWAIYEYHDYRNNTWIARFGNKVYGEEEIKARVKCDDDAFKMYRR